MGNGDFTHINPCSATPWSLISWAKKQPGADNALEHRDPALLFANRATRIPAVELYLFPKEIKFLSSAPLFPEGPPQRLDLHISIRH